MPSYSYIAILTYLVQTLFQFLQAYCNDGLVRAQIFETVYWSVWKAARIVADKIWLIPQKHIKQKAYEKRLEKFTNITIYLYTCILMYDILVYWCMTYMAW